jgi:hypothetical protein
MRAHAQFDRRALATLRRQVGNRPGSAAFAIALSITTSIERRFQLRGHDMTASVGQLARELQLPSATVAGYLAMLLEIGIVWARRDAADIQHFLPEPDALCWFASAGNPEDPEPGEPAAVGHSGDNVVVLPVQRPVSAQAESARHYA